MTRLRPISQADISFLDRQHSDPESAGDHNWFGFRVGGRLAAQFAAGEVISEDGGALAITDDEDHLVGDIGWRTVLNAPPPNGACWQLGIWVAPEGRGQGHGSAAQRLVAEYLFAHTTRERIEASTEAGNIGEQRALEKAGFAKEGVLRSACFRDGEWRDMVIYSKLRGE